jgi:hypothetical protein
MAFLLKIRTGGQAAVVEGAKAPAVFHAAGQDVESQFVG